MKCLALSQTVLKTHPIFGEIEEELKKKDRVYKPLTKSEQENIVHFIETNKTFFDRYGEEGIESNPSFQQIIFYCVVRRGNKFFVYQRGGKEAGSKETRLAMKISAGVGGHIEPFDSKITDALYRELDEELIFRKDGNPIIFQNAGELNVELFHSIADINVIGMVKDHVFEIDRVHIGLVTIVTLTDELVDVSIRENEGNIFGQFMDREEYVHFIESGSAVPEIWTQILAENSII